MLGSRNETTKVSVPALIGAHSSRETDGQRDNELYFTVLNAGIEASTGTVNSAGC